MKTQFLQIAANPSNTAKVLEFVEDALNNEHIPVKTIHKVLICTDEIFANIAQYAHADATEIRCSVSDNQVILEFIDDGIPYNPLETPEPDIAQSAEERTIGGCGIHIVRKLVNHIEYKYIDQKNVLSFSIQKE